MRKPHLLIACLLLIGFASSASARQRFDVHARAALVAAAVHLFKEVRSDTKIGVEAGPAGEAVSFNRDVRPILSQKCFRCHGPDAAARKGDLRLDRREDAIAARALVANDPDASELIRRVTAEGDAAMPPRDLVSSTVQAIKTNPIAGTHGITRSANGTEIIGPAADFASRARS